MTNEEVTKNIWRNSISNYVSVGLRMALGLLMFRLLCQNLEQEEFGYWSLLWSLFGYGILLDFGFGFTAVKRVAELSVKNEWDELSRVLSTIFYLYVVIGIVICTLTLLGADSIIQIFKITPGKQPQFREILVYFFCGMGIIFPFGIFPEILIGQQRIFLTNIIFAIGIVFNFIALALAIHFHLGIKIYFIIGLVSALLPCLISAFFAIRGLPHVKIIPSFFSWGMVRSTMSFSIFAYVSSASTLILARTDQIVLSTALAVSAVGLYQAGAKIGEMFSAVAQQLPDTFTPAAAHLNAKGDTAFLQRLLVDGTRFSVMIATPLYFVCAFYMEGILKIVTGGKFQHIETFWIAQVMLLWGYMGLITQTVTKKIFMMCGHEKRLTKLTVGEALLNIILSVGMVLYFKNVVCVAIGSLIATTVFGWGFVWPWAAHEAKLSGWQLACKVLFPIWIACLPLIAFLLIGRFTPWMDIRSNVPMLILESIVAMFLAVIGLWKGALTAREKEILWLKFGKIFTRSTPA